MISRRFCTPIVLATMLFVGRPAHAQSPADVALARDLFKEGADFAQKSQWNEARKRYEKSLALKRSPRTLYSLGFAYRNLRRFVESLESYRAFLVEPKKDDDKPYEQPARDAIAELESQVAHVDIKVKVVPPNEDLKMTLTIDGIIVPEAAYGYPRLVDPGTHAVAVHAPGYIDATQSVTLTEGQKLDVSLRLERVPGPIIDGPPKTEVPVVPTALIAGGSALFAVGLTVGMVGVQKAMDAPTRDGEDAKSAKRLALAGDILGGLGIVAAGAGITLLILDKYGKPTKTPAKATTGWVVPFVAPNGVGIVGRF